MGVPRSNPDNFWRSWNLFQVERDRSFAVNVQLNFYNEGLHPGPILRLRVSDQFSDWTFTCLSGQRWTGNSSLHMSRLWVWSPSLAYGESIVWSLHRSVTFNQLKTLASSCKTATLEWPMLEIYNLWENSHLFQPILKQIPTPPKIVGIWTGYPHLPIWTPCYLVFTTFAHMA